MYLTLYEISKITKCNRSSLKTIINYLNLHKSEQKDAVPSGRLMNVR